MEHLLILASTNTACVSISAFASLVCVPNLKHLYRIELDKTCFAQDAAYYDSKDLAKRTNSNKILRDRAHEITRNYNYDGYQRALACVGYKFLDQKTESAIGLN